MRICVISTTIMTCPPAGYSGLEMVAWQQADGLTKLGHEVVLVAPRGSTPPNGVELHETTIGESEELAYSGYRHKLPQFDAIIDNSWEKFSYILKMEGNLNIPILGVMHAPAYTMYRVPPPVRYPCLIAISKDQATAISEHLGVPSRVAYNGIDLDYYKPSNEPRSNRYLFLARMSKIKGPHIAIDVARRCRVGLDLVGDDKITGEPEYVSMLRLQSINNISYIGNASRDECVKWFSTRYALLHMNMHYREPFGLAPVEAQAAGCPVIAFNNGAMRETIRNGKTGFLVTSQEEVEKLVESDAISKIDREYCRKWAKKFSVENSIKAYDKHIKEAIITGGW